MTFQELYRELKRKPTPLEQFIQRLQGITCRGKSSVRNWGKGRYYPSVSNQKKIAAMIGEDVEVLFPSNPQIPVEDD